MKKMMAMILLMFSICILLTGCKKPVNPPAPDPDPKPPVTEPNDKDNDNGGNNNNDDDGDKDGEETKIPVDEDFNDMTGQHIEKYYDTLDEFLEFINKADFKKKYMNYFEETLKEIRNEDKVLMMSYKGKVDSFNNVKLYCLFEDIRRPAYDVDYPKFVYGVSYVKKEHRELLDKGYEAYMKKYGYKHFPLPDNWKEVLPKADYKGVYIDKFNIGGTEYECHLIHSIVDCAFSFVKDQKIISISISTTDLNEAKEILKDLKLEYVKLK